MRFPHRLSYRLSVYSGIAMIAISICPAQLLAHHGYAAYDMTTTRSISGKITAFVIANPHGQFKLDERKANGQIVHWSFETGATVRQMRAQGFTPDSLRPGDEVTIFYNPAKNGSSVGVFIRAEFPDGNIVPPKRQG